MSGVDWLKTTCIIWLVACLVSQGSTDSFFDVGNSDKEILDMLLQVNRYDNRLRPPVRGTLVVTVSLLLLSLATPDESSLKYDVEFLLHQEWFDPRLKYSNSSEYTFLNAIHHHSQMWLPDTYFVMHGETHTSEHFALRIYQNGTVSYVMRIKLILGCQAALSIFPFDDKYCAFCLESMTHEETKVEYVWENNNDYLKKSPSLTVLNAYLIQNVSEVCYRGAMWRRNYSCLKVGLTFTRDRTFYYTTVFIPGIILVTSSFITFWLEWNAVPARAMIGVTTMLNFFTTSNRFRSTLPVVSNLTAMNLWDGVSMCFIYASLLEFVCVNYVGRKRPLHSAVYLPEAISTTKDHNKDEEDKIFTIDCVKCDLKPCKHSSNVPVASRVKKKEPPHPIRVAKNIDVIARIVFPLAYIVFLLFFFIHYKGFS